MNPEVLIVYISSCKLLTVVLLAFIYARAGRGWRWGSWKVRRKIVIPSVLTLALIGFSLWEKSFSVAFMIASILGGLIAFGVMHIGYGNGNTRRILKVVFRNETLTKGVQRVIVGALYGGAFLPVAYITGNWLVYTLSVVVASLTSLTLGTFNPIDAASEETLIGFTEFLFPLWL